MHLPTPLATPDRAPPPARRPEGASGRVRAVFFDFGGTLYAYGAHHPVVDPATLLALVPEAGGSAEGLEAACREAVGAVYRAYLVRPYFLHRDFFADVFRRALRNLGVEPGPALVEAYLERRKAAAAARPFPPLRPGVHETLRALRGRGVFVGLVSNTDDEILRRDLARAGLEGAFELYLTSESARSCKPDPQIFREALRRAGVGAADALFVGDNVEQDVAGANRVGIRSVLLCGEAEAGRPRAHEPWRTVADIPAVLDLVDPADGGLAPGPPAGPP